MNPTFSVEAIIFNRYDFRESDSKINIYALNYGRFDLIVRGTKKPKSKLAGHIEPMSRTKIMIIKGKKYSYAGSAKIVNVFSKLKSNYNLLADSGQAMRMIKTLIKPGEADNNIFFLLENYLQTINSKNFSEKQSNFLFLFFAFKLISYLGYAPELDTCLNCNNTKTNTKYYFNYKEGGLICDSCRDKSGTNLLISSYTVTLMKDILNLDINKASAIKIENNNLIEFRKILDMYSRYNLNYKI